MKYSQDKDHKITQEGNLWVLVYKNKNKTFKHHFSSKKEAEENWNILKKGLNTYVRFEEGKKEDVDGDGDIDSKDYLAKRDIAIQKAKSKVKNESLEGIKTSEDLDKLKSYLFELRNEGIIHLEVYNNILSLVKQIIISTKSQSEDLNEDIDLDHKVKYSKSNDTYQVWLGDEIVTDFATEERAENEAKRLNHLQDIKRLDKAQMKEDIDLGHEDNEPHMIKGELYRIGKYAMELYAMAEELEETGQEIDFPAWWQSMITDSASKMVKAKHYLDFELKEPAIDAVVDKLTGEKPHMGEPDYSDVTEGFLDRMKAGVKGAVAGVGQAAKNIGAAVKGDSPQFKSVSNTANMAKLGQKVKTFGKEIDDVINDINKLFPKEKLSKDPKLKGKIEKYLATLNQTKTLNAAITTPPVDENMFTGRNPYNMGSSDSDDFVGDDISIDILAGKIAKALKNPENQNEDDQNNIKQARKALNLGDIEVAKKIAKPYITEKIAKQLKEYSEYDFSGNKLIANTPIPTDINIFKKFFPTGVASMDNAKASLQASDNTGIKDRMGRYAPMFAHVQYHEFEDQTGEKYRAHQTQYYNSNFDKQDPNFNPSVTALTLFKLASPDELSKDTNIGSILVKTGAYIKDLANLNISKRAM
jgi:hypothetical protein